ncbi:MAG: 2-hydroxychromene-2-carboxylate isomerase [Myxococcota bacterium]
MSLSIDVFWSFRSPYSYLVTPRLVALAADHELDVEVRPVQPLAIRQADFFDRVNPLWPPYLARDVHRVAEFLGLPFHWPRPDPVVQTLVDGRLRTASEQPHIHRLTRLGVAAAERGHGLSFIDEVSRLIWGGVEGWDQGSHLAEATARAGLDLAELDAAIESAPERYDTRIEQNQKDHAAAGHWGVPTMVFRGEPFFGQDRFDLLVWRLRGCGLRPQHRARSERGGS